MAAARRENRGPNAAAGNRRALLAAAVEVFSEQGFSAPLSAVAKRAGVGQGSLYRHFPDRVSLALAVFADNVAELEALAERPDTTLDRMLARITDQTIASIAFVEIITPVTSDVRLGQVTQRMRMVVAKMLDRAVRAGTVRPTLRAEDVLLAIGMVAALLAKTPSTDRRTTADAAWELLLRAF